MLYCRLVLQAADRGTPPLSSTATVRVQVVDVNDNSPAIPTMEPVFIAESNTNPYSSLNTLVYVYSFFHFVLAF